MGTAAAMTVYPVVPDFDKYPGTGRDTNIHMERLDLQDTGLNMILTLICLSIRRSYIQVGH